MLLNQRYLYFELLFCVSLILGKTIEINDLNNIL